MASETGALKDTLYLPASACVFLAEALGTTRVPECHRDGKGEGLCAVTLIRTLTVGVWPFMLPFPEGFFLTEHTGNSP